MNLMPMIIGNNFVAIDAKFLVSIYDSYLSDVHYSFLNSEKATRGLTANSCWHQGESSANVKIFR